MRSVEVQDMFAQTRNALTKRYKQTYMFVKLTRKPSYGQHPIPYKPELTDEDLRPATSSRPGMAKKHCHPADFAAKEKSLLGGTGSCGGIITAPYGGSQRSEEHSKDAVRGQLLVQPVAGWPTGCPSERPVGLSLKIGVGCGADSPLIKAHGLPAFVNGPWTLSNI